MPDQDNPEFLRIQKELGEHLKAMEELWAKLQERFPIEDYFSYALNNEGRIFIVKCDSGYV